MKRKIISIFLLIIISTIICFVVMQNNNKVQALSKYGSQGEEVRQIQTKLKRWGYYNGSVDGIFGSKTLAAVKLFQKKYGLTVDGLAGPITRTLILNLTYTPVVTPTIEPSQEDELITLNVTRPMA